MYDRVEYIKTHWKKVPIPYYDYKKLDKSFDSSSSYQDQTNNEIQTIDNNIMESEKASDLKWVLIFIGLTCGVPCIFYLAHLRLP